MSQEKSGSLNTAAASAVHVTQAGIAAVFKSDTAATKAALEEEINQATDQATQAMYHAEQAGSLAKKQDEENQLKVQAENEAELALDKAKIYANDLTEQVVKESEERVASVQVEEDAKLAQTFHEMDQSISNIETIVQESKEVTQKNEKFSVLTSTESRDSGRVDSYKSKAIEEFEQVEAKGHDILQAAKEKIENLFGSGA